MPAPRIRAEYDSLTKIEKTFARNADAVWETSRRIKQQVETLQSGDWTGRGASAFYEEVNSSVLPSMTGLGTAMEEAQQTTVDMIKLMRTTDEEMARLIHLMGDSGVAAASGGLASASVGGTFEGVGASASPAEAGVKAKMTKAQAKKAAAKGATGMNYTASLLAGAGATAAIFGGPIGLGVGAVLGLGSAAAWWMGTSYSDLANDPPRDDFQIETKFEMHKYNFQIAENEFEAACQDLSRLLVSKSAAIKSLVTSLERYDGVTALMNKTDSVEAGDGEYLQFVILQADAVAHNARASAELGEELIELEPRLNLAWGQFQKSIASTQSDLAKTSSSELGAKYAELWQESKPSFQQIFQYSDSEMKDLTAVVEEKMHAQPLDLRTGTVLLDIEWVQAIRLTSDEFRQLSDSFAELKSTMESLGDAS